LEFPLIDIRPLPERTPAQRRLVLDLDRFDTLIVVSGNAVRHGMHWLETYWPQMPAGPNWLTVGAGSAEHLDEYGIEAQFPRREMNSEGLLALPALRQVKDRRILIVKGEGGRSYLREQLTRRGARVEELSVYRREPPRRSEGELYELLRAEHCGALLLGSGEALHNMVSLLARRELADVGGLLMVVPGPRVAAIAREFGFARVAAAANATDAAMVASLEANMSDEVHPAGGPT